MNYEHPPVADATPPVPDTTPPVADAEASPRGFRS